MSQDATRCPACNVLITQHLGLYGTCAEHLDARREVERLKAEIARLEGEVAEATIENIWLNRRITFLVEGKPHERPPCHPSEDPPRCKACREVGALHCSDPVNCGNMEPRS